jgi:hypothetical protein
LDLSSLKSPGDRGYVHLQCNDLLDRRCETTVVAIPAAGK